MAACVLPAVTAAGQAPASGPILNDEERLVAAEAAYERGSRAFRAENYAEAARWYERADELVPAANALIQSIRSYQLDGKPLQAATLAYYLLARHGQNMMKHTAFIHQVAPKAFVATVSCAACRVEFLSREVRYRTFYLEPEMQHRFRVHFETGEQSLNVSGQAGERQTYFVEPPKNQTQAGSLVPPGMRAAHSSAGQPTNSGQADSIKASRDRNNVRRLPPAVFYTTLAAAAAVGGVTIWSWLDTRSKRNAFDSAPTLDGLEAGNQAERRTTILIAATGGAVGLAAIFAAFTDWKGLHRSSKDDETKRKGSDKKHKRKRPRASAGRIAGGGLLTVAGVF